MIETRHKKVNIPCTPALQIKVTWVLEEVAGAAQSMDGAVQSGSGQSLVL